MRVFAVYLLGLGVVLLLVPNLLLRLLAIPETDEVWIRIVGMLVLFLSYYYHTVARHELRPLMKVSVICRASVLLFMLGFVLVDLAPPIMIGFGVVDLAAAGWTAAALRGRVVA